MCHFRRCILEATEESKVNDEKEIIVQSVLIFVCHANIMKYEHWTMLDENYIQLLKFCTLLPERDLIWFDFDLICCVGVFGVAIPSVCRSVVCNVRVPY